MRQRCETCSIRRSHTNIVVCLLLLAALLSYNWYDILTRRLEAEAAAPIVVSVPTVRAPEPAAAPPPAPPQADDIASERPVRRSRPAARPAPAGPPADLEGLY